MSIYNEINKSNLEDVLHYIILAVVAGLFAWSICPMLLLRENYIFTIFDGLDSYAGMVQNIHDNQMYFRLFDQMPFMHGIEGKYTMMSYTLYDFLNCMLGYLWGQIITRVIGVIMGFVTMRMLLKYIFRPSEKMDLDIICLISIVYAVTPVAPNRMIGYASLPLVIYTFLILCQKKDFSKISIAAMFLPLLSSFQAVYIFVLALWIFSTLIKTMLDRKINKNLFLSFVGMCLVTLLANYATFLVALSADETNRSLFFGEKIASFDYELLKNRMLYGLIHSSALHHYVILILLFFSTLFVIYELIKDYSTREKRIYSGILFGGWFFWLASAFIGVFQTSGFRTGILVIDGYQWGESNALMRIVWYLMIGASYFILRKISAWKMVICLALIAQVGVITCSETVFNDTRYSVQKIIYSYMHKDTGYISYKDFFDYDLFNEIKEDISYDGEGVAAYGYCPSVLMFNNFNAIDGYLSVHSMEWQNQFREIIAPALDRYDNYRNYYDGWGGRMYLFGELEYGLMKDKTIDAYPLYINADAFKKYGGKYILSRAQISNSEEIGFEFIKDYDSDDSMYHIWLYRVR